MSGVERVGLVVHYGLRNYGNHLTNFAARRVLEKCGCRVDMIVFTGGLARRRLAAVCRLPLRTLRVLQEGGILRKAGGWLARMPATSQRQRSSELQALEQGRLRRFEEFASLHLRPRLVPVRQRFDLNRKYDQFVVGSDQIWNCNSELAPWFFLDFADDAKKTCLAPSVGQRSLPLEWIPMYKRWLSSFEELTVREFCWVDGFNQLLGTGQITLLPDPTLMLSVQEWEGVASEPAETAPYLLVYELGTMSDESKKFAEELASREGLETLWLSQHTRTAGWDSNASDFLAMVRDATAVMTDSYHGTIFGFLFDRPLIVLPRSGAEDGMNTRIETLLDQLALADRAIQRQSPRTALAHDYSAGRAALSQLQDATWAYLSRRGFAAPPALAQGARH